MQVSPNHEERSAHGFSLTSLNWRSWQPGAKVLHRSHVLVTIVRSHTYASESGTYGAHRVGEHRSPRSTTHAIS